MRTFLYCALWRRFGAKITPPQKLRAQYTHPLPNFNACAARIRKSSFAGGTAQEQISLGPHLSVGTGPAGCAGKQGSGRGRCPLKGIIANLIWKWNCSYGNRAKREIPGSKKFVPGNVLEPTGEYRHIAGILGEISQYAQFAAAFGRIGLGKSAATGRRIDSGAAIRKSSCRG